MGQSAAIAYNDGINTKIIGNKWSTNLPEVIRHFVEEKRKEDENFNIDVFATDLFNKLMNTGGVTAVTYYNENDMEENDESYPFHILDKLEDGSALVYTTYAWMSDEKPDTVDTDAETATKESNHACDGVSMYYTKGEGKINFYIDPKYLDTEDEDGNELDTPTFCYNPFYTEVA